MTPGSGRRGYRDRLEALSFAKSLIVGSQLDDLFILTRGKQINRLSFKHPNKPFPGCHFADGIPLLE